MRWLCSHAGSFTAVTAAIGVVCLGGVALPAAAEAGGYGIAIQAIYDPDGNPGLVAKLRSEWRLGYRQLGYLSPTGHPSVRRDRSEGGA